MERFDTCKRCGRQYALQGTSYCDSCMKDLEYAVRLIRREMIMNRWHRLHGITSEAVA